MTTVILTDSNSGLSPDEAVAEGIRMIPMPVIIDGEIFYEGRNLSEREFYSALGSSHTVSTSQPSPGELTELWDSLLEDGCDSILYIPMSSSLSNSCSTAVALSSEYGERVFVADNRRISVTLRESVLTAAALAGQGKTGEEIRDFLEADSDSSSIYIAVDTLEYLRKGGRITPSAAAIADILNIKPILTIQGDRLDSFAKARSMKKAMKCMTEALKKDAARRFSNVPPERLHIGTAGTCLSDEEIHAWMQCASEAFPSSEICYRPLSLSIGCHVGPHAFGIGLTVIPEI